MMQKELENEKRLSVLETHYGSLNDKICEIANNHLVHLAQDVKDTQTAIQKIDNKLAYWSG
jgi:hypothetical protein